MDPLIGCATRWCDVSKVGADLGTYGDTWSTKEFNAVYLSDYLLGSGIRDESRHESANTNRETQSSSTKTSLTRTVSVTQQAVGFCIAENCEIVHF